MTPWYRQPGVIPAIIVGIGATVATAILVACIFGVNCT
jgi:hypothetical protein